MIYHFPCRWPSFFPAAKPLGGGHGTWRQADGAAIAMERTRPGTVYDALGGRLSQLPHVLISDSRETITAMADHLRCSPETVWHIRTVDDSVAAFRHSVARISGHKEPMGFLYDHDEFHVKAA